MFKAKTENYLELLPPETELLGGTKSKIFKMKTVKVFLIQKLMKYINKIQEPFIHLFLINHLVNYQILHQKS